MNIARMIEAAGAAASWVSTSARSTSGLSLQKDASYKYNDLPVCGRILVQKSKAARFGWISSSAALTRSFNSSTSSSASASY